MKQKMYNWREMPLPLEERKGSSGNSQQENGDPRPACCKFTGLDRKVESVNERYLSKCREYETFSRNITKKAFRVGMDIAVMRILAVGDKTISVLFWLDLSFFDNRLRLCNCQANEDNIPEKRFLLIGAHKAEKWFLPDTALLDLQLVRHYNSITMSERKLKATEIYIGERNAN